MTGGLRSDVGGRSGPQVPSRRVLLLLLAHLLVQLSLFSFGLFRFGLWAWVLVVPNGQLGEVLILALLVVVVIVVDVDIFCNVRTGKNILFSISISFSSCISVFQVQGLRTLRRT